MSHMCVSQQYADGDSFLLLVSSSFGSVNLSVYVHEGQAGEEQEQDCYLVCCTTDLQVLPSDCFKGSVL